MEYCKLTYSSDYLSHHGILGQKWGKRNGPPYPLRENDHSKREKQENWKKSLGGIRNVSKYGRKGAIGSQNKIGKETKSIFSDEEKDYIKYAAIGAAIGLGVGVGAYLYIKHKANSNIVETLRNDIILDKDTVFQRISPAGEKDLHDVFYAAFDEHDKNRYEGLLPEHYKNRGNADVVKKLIKSSTGDVKIAGHDTAEEVFNKIISDMDIRRTELRDMGITSYDDFNRYAVLNREDGYKELYHSFFNELKSRGYSGFIDINDQDYSGYGAKCPLILFNDQKQFSISKITQVDAGKAAVENNKLYKELAAKETLENIKGKAAKYAIYGSLIGGYGGVYIKSLKSDNDDKTDDKKNKS